MSYHPTRFQGVNGKMRDAADVFGSFGMMLRHPSHGAAANAVAGGPPHMIAHHNASYSIDAILGLGQRGHYATLDGRTRHEESLSADLHGAQKTLMYEKKSFDLSPLGHRRDGPDSPEALSDASRHGEQKSIEIVFIAQISRSEKTGETPLLATAEGL